MNHYMEINGDLFRIEAIESVYTFPAEEAWGVKVRLPNETLTVKKGMTQQGALALVNEVQEKLQERQVMPTNTAVTTFKQDLQGFFRENRTNFYWIAVLLLLDHFVFAGAFRAKLQDLFQVGIDKLQKSLEGSKDA